MGVGGGPWVQNLSNDGNRAFTTVIAENQFSTLGIVLLATLSRFTKATGIKFEEETRQQPQVKKTLPPPSTEDRGERVSRADVDTVAALEPRPQKSQKKSEASASDEKTALKKSKKTKKKKNAIDDLFSGLF